MTSADELAYNAQNIGDLLKNHVPEDVGFAFFIFHRNDGAVAYSTNTEFGKLARILRDFMERADDSTRKI